MIRKRYAVLGIAVALLAGILLGPTVRLLCWTAVFDWYPSTNAKVIASLRLYDTEQGKTVLYDRIRSKKREVRELAVWPLATFEKPVYVANLLGKLDEGCVDERLLVIGSLDYASQHEFVLGTLRYEIAHAGDKRIIGEAKAVLRSLEEASDGRHANSQSAPGDRRGSPRP